MEILAIILKFMIISTNTQRRNAQVRIKSNVQSKSLSQEHFN